MNSYPHPVIEQMSNTRTNETVRIWVCSNRLINLIIKKSNKGTWHRQYISIEDMPWSNYRLRVVGTDGLIVMSIDKRKII